MEKTLVIDGRQVSFKSTAGIGYRYFEQFGTEYIVDMMKLEDFIETARLDTTEIIAPNGKTVAVQRFAGDRSKVNMQVMYNIVWVLAKTADNSIPDPLTWYDSFENFDVSVVFAELQELIAANNKSNSKN